MSEGAFVVVASVAALVVMSVFAVACGSIECGAKTEGHESDYGPIKGCMVKVNGKWVPYDRWRVVEE